MFANNQAPQQVPARNAIILNSTILHSNLGPIIVPNMMNPQLVGRYNAGPQMVVTQPISANIIRPPINQPIITQPIVHQPVINHPQVINNAGFNQSQIIPNMNVIPTQPQQGYQMPMNQKPINNYPQHNIHPMVISSQPMTNQNPIVVNANYTMPNQLPMNVSVQPQNVNLQFSQQLAPNNQNLQTRF